MEKVEPGTLEYSRFMEWYGEYNALYEPWQKAVNVSLSHEDEMLAFDLRPTQEQLDELYGKYKVS